jgi:hypothetical protein
MYGYYGHPLGEFYEGAQPSGEFPWHLHEHILSCTLEQLFDMVEAIAHEFVCRHARPEPPRPIALVFQSGTLAGWAQPPRPADVVVSFDPKASKRDQARMVLYDYYHDDPLRYWSDNEAVKRCFGVKTKEDHDPLHLIAAYENRKDKVWSCHGTGMSWAEMNKAVQQAIAHRTKLGPLPRSSYDTNPVVIYYYDNDKMKRITYPGMSIPAALNPNNVRWWAWGQGDQSDAGKAAGLDDVHTREADDPKKIKVEREHPGWTTKQKKQALKSQYPWISDMDSGSAGDWGNEQFTWDKDVAGTGVIGSITGAILAVISAVLDATGIGAIVGVPLGIATPFIVAAINATDTALHAGDFGAALANLGPALIQASVSAASKGMGAAGINIPQGAMQALGGTVSSIAKSVIAGQQKKLDFGQIWSEVAKKAQSFGKIGDAEAQAIGVVLGGPGGQSGTAGHVFTQGYLAGKFLDMPSLAGLAKILSAYAQFADPRIINIALLGMGIGHISGTQAGTVPNAPPASAKPAAAPAAGPVATHGAWDDAVGQIITRGDPHSDLAAFVHLFLAPRYGLGTGHGAHLTGLSCPEGYDLVATDHQIACAYRRKSACLAGFTSELGTFVCTDWDFPPCPQGMGHVRGSPKNWCFPQVPDVHVGQAAPPVDPHPDYGPLSRGCPQGYYWDPIDNVCKYATPLPGGHYPLPRPPPPPPHTGLDLDPSLGWETAKRAAEGLTHMPGAWQLGFHVERYFDPP